LKKLTKSMTYGTVNVILQMLWSILWLVNL